MTSQTYAAPPRIASWLLSLFSSDEEAESLLGDMVEEHSRLASKSRVDFARSWYWRQTRKTILHLIGSSFRTAPWLTAAAVIGGFLLNRLLFGLPERAIFGILDRYQVFEHHFDVYLFFTTYGIASAHVIASMLVACVAAWVVKGREMAVTTTLALVHCVMTVAALAWVVAFGNGWIFLHMLPWNFAEWLAIVLGGAAVRMHRSAARNSFSPG